MTEIQFVQFLLESLKINEAELSVVHCKFQEAGTSNIVLHIETNSKTEFAQMIKEVKSEFFDRKKQKFVEENEFEYKVKELYKKGLSLRMIAAKFDVSHMTIQRILNQQTIEKQEQFSKVYTYLMKDKRNNTYKIGKSNNPVYREKTLQSEAPQIDLLAYCEENIISEKILHELFKDKRIRGEWFALDANDANRIIKLMNKYEYSNLPNTNKFSNKDISKELVINAITEIFKINEYINQQNLVSQLIKITNCCDRTIRRRIDEIIENKISFNDSNERQCTLTHLQQIRGKATIYKLQPVNL